MHCLKNRDNGTIDRKSLFYALAAKNWPILGLEAVGMSLEDVFVKLMDADAKKKLAGERRNRAGD